MSDDASDHGRLTAPLPRTLALRTRVLREAAPADGPYVLYVLDGNLRTQENQALDTALTLANAHGLPPVVLAELREDQPLASDRHHRFQLEGLRALQQGLAAMGVRVCVHVHRPGKRTDAARQLIAGAALTVTDDVPTRPYRDRRTRLLAAADAASGGPVLAVDASCLVPMRQVGRAYDRAFKFRNATKELRRRRLDDGFPPVAPRQPRYAGDLGIAGDDLSACDLGALTAACAIDHTVPPVPEFPGGEPAAAAHWADWRDSRLSGYAAKRNDALQESYVSRLSPYLRHGMIAATRVAREAAAAGGKGADKFLDELLIWREMSWAYAFHVPDHDSTAIVPDWAWETLKRREIDPRPALYDWDTLARGETDDALWNAAQLGYFRRGYLHNNLRMTWAKELLTWTPGPERTAELLVDLNNRYSLDGGDPNSYSGLFWCLGAFDRPFEPERAIFGTVRHRSTEVHAKRLDVAAYTARQVRGSDLPTVAVVGAGLSGLMCARTLADHGVPVTVFDKGRLPGGRTAAKRLGDGRFADHGAPKLEIGDPRLTPYRAAWREREVLGDWTPAGSDQPWQVALPTTRGLAQHLGAELDIRQGTAVTELQRDRAGWQLVIDGETHGPFDRVVVTAPARQAADLIAAHAPALAARARTAAYRPIMSALAVFDQLLEVDCELLLPVDDPVLEKAVRDTAKPGRDPLADVWALHATADWSQAHKDDDFDPIARALFDAFRAHQPDLPDPRQLIGHRWLYGQVTQPVGEDCLFDSGLGLGACGDWCLGPTAGDALLSGAAAAGRVFASEPELAARRQPAAKRRAAE
ncbi:FAD-dependent oxidoreductase [Rhodovibrio sodomensis]|uniref:FAD-dependent oxidoreductase n=1 Tax=Rhodovibrio sodomensis TaxID=1088 RepID=UPI00190340FD